MRFVVIGAGAVGSVLGGYLARDHHDVVLVCREPHASAISKQKGLRIKSATGEFVAHLDATSGADDLSFEDTCILITAKSYDTQACMEWLDGRAPADRPVVSFQNGVANEGIIAEGFGHVLGGVCSMTCSCLHAGQVSLRKQGRLVVGKYPKGADPFAKKLGKIFEDAGFDASVSKNIVSDKWLKLVANLQSGWHAVIENRDHDTRDFIDLKVGVLEEARLVLKAAKIKAVSCDGRGLSIEELITDLRKPRAGTTSSSVRVNNSTWQNLYLKRSRMENGYFHEPILELAAEHGIDVPYNAVALDVVNRSAQEGLGTNAFRVADIVEQVRQRGTNH